MATIQIRNVPEETSRELKARAALQGKSLSEYTLEVLQNTLKNPSREQLMQRIMAQTAKTDLPPMVEVLQEGREGR